MTQNTNRSGTFVHVHAYGETDDPVTGRTVRTPIATVTVAPNEPFPDWAEPGHDYDEALLQAPDEQDDRGAMPPGLFPFDLDQQVTVRKQQEQEDRERTQRQEHAAQVNQLMSERRTRDASPEKSTASGAEAKSKAGSR